MLTSDVFGCQPFKKHRHVNTMIDSDRRERKLIYIFEVRRVKLMPKVEHALAVVHHPADEVVSFTTLVLVNHVVGCLGRGEEALSNQVRAAFQFALVARIAECYEEAQLLEALDDFFFSVKRKRL